MKKFILIPVVAAVIVACKAVILSTPSQIDIDRVSKLYPNYTLAELNKGKALYELNCQSCHGLKNPRRESEDKWKKIVPKMVKKALKKEIEISKEDEKAILKYLITMSSKPKPE
jgi:cytochrome c5